MVYTPKWKKKLIFIFGLFENLIFTGNILGWSALNHMLKTEKVYEEYCFTEINFDNINKSFDFLNLNNSFLTNFNSSIVKNLNNSILNNLNYLNESINIFPTTIINNLFKNKFFNDNKINISLDNKINLVNIKEIHLNHSKRRIKFKNFTNKHYLINSTFHLNCKKQDTILNLAYTIGTFLNGFTAFIWGFLLDKLGLRIVRLIINFFLSVGCLLLCFTSKENPYLIFPAISFLCLGGVPLRIADMQFANLFPTKRSSVITFYSGAFSASSIVFVILKYFYEDGLNYIFATGILFLISLLMLPFTFLILPSDKIQGNNKKIKNLPNTIEAFTIKNNHFQDIKNESVNEIKFSRKKFNESYNQNLNKILSQDITLKKFNYLSSSDLKPKLNDKNTLVEFDCEVLNNLNAIDNYDKENNLKNDILVNNFNNKVNFNNFSKVSSKPKVLPIKLSLYSFSYLVHQYWFCWLITYIIMYVGSMNLWIKRITEDIYKASFYLKIYGLLQVFSLILSPIAGLIMDYEVNKAEKETNLFLKRFKMAKAGFWPILFTNLSLVGVVICKYFNHENAIYISIFLNTILRSFLIAVASAYLRIRFPAEHFNKLLGIMSSIGALMTLIQFPLFILESNENQVIWVNLLNTFLTVLSFSNSILLLINPLQKRFIARDLKLESLY